MKDRQTIRVFLTNGFKYQGIEKPTEEGFISILDEKTKSIMKFPLTSVMSIEVIE